MEDLGSLSDLFQILFQTLKTLGNSGAVSLAVS